MRERSLERKTLGGSFVRTIGITMPCRTGFDLRLAVKFAQCVRKFRSTVQVRKEEILADGKNVLELLVLAAVWRSKLEIVAAGDDAVQTIEGIKELFLDQENINVRC